MCAPHGEVLRRVALAFVAVVVALGCGACSSSLDKKSDGYCALMPDSVGLYVGNPVTHLGYRIGKVDAITPGAQSVRVDFTVDGGRAVPHDVQAVTRSTSILADRSLELVGDYASGARLSVGDCIPLDRSLTPKSLSEVIGSSTDFINSINPAESENVGEVVSGIDQAVRGQGAAANKLLTTTSSLLDSPEQAIGDMSSITANLTLLTNMLTELEPTMKSVFQDASNYVLPELDDAITGVSSAFEGLLPVFDAAGGLEKELGPQIQQLLDATSVAIRKGAPRAPYYASLMNVAPRLINGFANVANNHEFTLHYRPPTYRLRAPEGVAACNIMNASMPGSCANVKGTPYAVDVALLQYVLTQAANR